jgi:hypothetical protein
LRIHAPLGKTACGTRDIPRAYGEDHPMAKFENQTLTGERVKIDGNEYKNCTFERCIIEYHGETAVRLLDCKFVACRWAFDGPAGNTIRFMSALYQNGDPTLQKLVDDTFDNVRKGSLPRIPNAAQAAAAAQGGAAAEPTPITKRNAPKKG